MPYIEQRTRELLKQGQSPTTAGELNYTFTKILLAYIKTKGLSYQTINDIIGALEGCKLEFYRMTAVDYENKKREMNGDVK